MARYRVLVCGGRNYDDRATVFATLSTLHEHYHELHIIQGGAQGADALAREWASANSEPWTT